MLKEEVLRILLTIMSLEQANEGHIIDPDGDHLNLQKSVDTAVSDLCDMILPDLQWTIKVFNDALNGYNITKMDARDAIHMRTDGGGLYYQYAEGGGEYVVPLSFMIDPDKGLSDYKALCEDTEAYIAHITPPSAGYYNVHSGGVFKVYSDETSLAHIHRPKFDKVVL